MKYTCVTGMARYHSDQTGTSSALSNVRDLTDFWHELSETLNGNEVPRLFDG